MENSRNISEPNTSERQESTGQESLTPSEEGKLGEPKISEELKGEELAPGKEAKFGEEEIVPKTEIEEKKPAIVQTLEGEETKKPHIERAISLGKEAFQEANQGYEYQAEEDRQEARNIYKQAA
jgi:hypothetical protein